MEGQLNGQVKDQDVHVLGQSILNHDLSTSQAPSSSSEHISGYLAEGKGPLQGLQTKILVSPSDDRRVARKLKGIHFFVCPDSFGP